MELDSKLIRRKNLISQPMFLSNKPAFMKEEYCPFETPSSKGFLQDFNHLDHPFHAHGSHSNHHHDLFDVQTGSNFDTFDAFPYGSSSNIDFYDYECKPFAINSGHGQVMDNFQSGDDNFMNLQAQRNSMDIMGSDIQGSNNMSLDYPEIKPVNFIAPDEVSCVTAKDECRKKSGANKTKALLPSTRRAWKVRKKNAIVKGQWTTEEDRYINIIALVLLTIYNGYNFFFCFIFLGLLL